MGKVKSLSSLKKIVKALRRQGKRIVFTNGCFDIIHPGHIKIFKEAKKKGDVLIVGLNTDASIQRLKGDKRPILNQRARSTIVSAIEFVDYVVLFGEDTPHELIKRLKPDYLVKGNDWERTAIIGREFVRKVYRINLCNGYSTTKIIERIRRLQ